MVHSEKGELSMESVDRPALLTTLGPEWLPSGDPPEEALMGPLGQRSARSGLVTSRAHTGPCPLIVEDLRTTSQAPRLPWGPQERRAPSQVRGERHSDDHDVA